MDPKIKQFIELILSLFAFALLVFSPLLVLFMHIKGKLTVRRMIAIFFIDLASLALLSGFLVDWEFSVWGLLISLLLSLGMLISGWYTRDFWDKKGVKW